MVNQVHDLVDGAMPIFVMAVPVSLVRLVIMRVAVVVIVLIIVVMIMRVAVALWVAVSGWLSVMAPGAALPDDRDVRSRQA
jgi:hypothetical protein